MDFPIITRLLLPCVSLRLSPKDQGRKRRGLHGARRCPWGSPHPEYFTYAGVHTHTQHQSSSLRRGPSKPRPAPSWRQDTEHTCKPRLSMCVRPGPLQVWPPGLLRESNLQDPPLPCNRVPGSSMSSLWDRWLQPLPGCSFAQGPPLHRLERLAAVTAQARSRSWWERVGLLSVLTPRARGKICVPWVPSACPSFRGQHLAAVGWC